MPFVERRRDINWKVWLNEDNTFSNKQVTHMILMDIRDELQKLNSLLHCHNFMAIPRHLKGIRENTRVFYPTRPKKKKVKNAKARR